MSDTVRETVSESEANTVLVDVNRLIESFKSVHMATLNSKGNPETSYTPFVLEDDTFYIFISSLASHTINIKRHPILSLFFIENEEDANSIFSRRRVSLECQARLIQSDTEISQNILDIFRTTHGATVDLLRTLSDFQLFSLKPASANFIKGFGQAYILQGEGLKEVRKIVVNKQV